MNKEQLSIVIIGLFSLGLVITGFYVSGTPNAQKFVRYDEKRLSDFSQIRYEVEAFYDRDKKLPKDLSELTRINRLVDPETNKPYEYKIVEDGTYELCTNFSNDYSTYQDLGGNNYMFDSTQNINFKKGPDCIKLIIPEYKRNKDKTKTIPYESEDLPGERNLEFPNSNPDLDYVKSTTTTVPEWDTKD